MTPRIIVADGFLSWPGGRVRAAIGKGGLSRTKREGDGATPIGVFPLRRLLYRADRLPTPHTGLPISAIHPSDGWSDDPRDMLYNQAVPLPHPFSHERLSRDDGVYDLIVPLGYNDDPPVPGLGSAIFLHCARPDYRPTEGCVAIDRADLLRLVAECDQATRIDIRFTAPQKSPFPP
jgi:L,D-peptidoglycan transpeptidase YkuD (ErfK/YbiS/YcfS/YnhG family)